MIFKRRLTVRPMIAAVALGTTALVGVAGGAIAADDGRVNIANRFIASGRAVTLCRRSGTGDAASDGDAVFRQGCAAIRVDGAATCPQGRYACSCP